MEGVASPRGLKKDHPARQTKRTNSTFSTTPSSTVTSTPRPVNTTNSYDEGKPCCIYVCVGECVRGVFPREKLRFHCCAVGLKLLDTGTDPGFRKAVFNC